MADWRMTGPATVVLLSIAGPQPAAADPQTAYPIVYDNMRLGGMLLGGATADGWLLPERMAPAMEGGERYRFYDLSGDLGEGRGAAPVSYGRPCEDTQYVEISPETAGGIGIGGDWDPLPRVPRDESTSRGVYRDATADILRQHGLTAPRIDQVRMIRIDLEGDGVEEVVVSAARRQPGPGGGVDQGDYSLVFLRKLHEGEVGTVLIRAEIHEKADPRYAPNRHEVEAILDLDGDGIMEIVVSSEYYEGASVAVYEVRGLEVRAVLAAGCGA